MNVVEGYYYTKEHEWIKIEGSLAKLGITDYAQSSLGDITFVELPAAETECKQFEQIATVESVKAASDVYSPVSGKVKQINKDLESNPELVNQSPYEKGWFLTIEISDESEKDKLLTSQQYKEYLKEL